jgi:hypothetical protein
MEGARFLRRLAGRSDGEFPFTQGIEQGQLSRDEAFASHRLPAKVRRLFKMRDRPV